MMAELAKQQAHMRRKLTTMEKHIINDAVRVLDGMHHIGVIFQELITLKMMSESTLDRKCEVLIAAQRQAEWLLSISKCADSVAQHLCSLSNE